MDPTPGEQEHCKIDAGYNDTKEFKIVVFLSHSPMGVLSLSKTHVSKVGVVVSGEDQMSPLKPTLTTELFCQDICNLPVRAPPQQMPFGFSAVVQTKVLILSVAVTRIERCLRCRGEG